MTATLTPPLCILTFATAGGGRCFYATTLHADAHELPEHVLSQVDALGARLAWRWVGQPYEQRLRGPAWEAAAAVTAADVSQTGRLVFC